MVSTSVPATVIIIAVLVVFITGGMYAVVSIVFGIFHITWLFVRHVIWDSFVNKLKARKRKENRFTSKDEDK